MRKFKLQLLIVALLLASVGSVSAQTSKGSSLAQLKIKATPAFQTQPSRLQI
jgi:hypothetical protein